MANKNIISQSLTNLFVILAIIVALLSLIVSSLMVKELAEEERNRIEIWAMATESIMSEEFDAKLVLSILQGNTTIPVILYDTDSHMAESQEL